MKVCTTCGIEYPLANFYKWARGKQGVTPRCKECHQAGNKKWEINNKEIRTIISRTYREKHPTKVKQACTTWRKKNLAYDAFRQHLRRLLKKKAVPSWVDEEHLFLIQEAYELARLRTEQFGFWWHVDHIVPLKFETACGLHCIDNLQVITAVENLRKRNLYIG